MARNLFPVWLMKGFDVISANILPVFASSNVAALGTPCGVRIFAAVAPDFGPTPDPEPTAQSVSCTARIESSPRATAI